MNNRDTSILSRVSLIVNLCLSESSQVSSFQFQFDLAEFVFEASISITIICNFHWCFIVILQLLYTSPILVFASMP